VVDPECVGEQRKAFQDENYRHKRRAEAIFVESTTSSFFALTSRAPPEAFRIDHLCCKYRYWNGPENSIEERVEPECGRPQVVRDNGLGNQCSGDRLEEGEETAEDEAGDDEVDAPVAGVTRARPELYAAQVHIYTFAVSYDWGVIAANLAFFEALEGGVFVDVELAAEVAGGEESDLFPRAHIRPRAHRQVGADRRIFLRGAFAVSIRIV